MHDIAGLVALAVIGLWIAYLVPHRLRYRQQLLESRTEDRFSEALRVLVVTDARRRDARGARVAEARLECGPDGPKRSGLLSPARGVPVGSGPAVRRAGVGAAVTDGRGGVVERPYGTGNTMSADDARRVAQARARRAAALARRADAARRRGVLTGVLLVASVVAWAVVGLTSVAVVAAIVPTVLLAGVVALGRRAVVTAQRADAAWERQQERAARAVGPRTRVTGRAHHPSDSHTEAIAQVAPAAGTSVTTVTASSPVVDDAAADESAPPADEAEPSEPSEPAVDAPVSSDAEAPAATTADETVSEGWSPVPVPRPTYTTKATAPRREPVPLVVEEPASAAAAPAAGLDDASGTADDAAPAAPSLDLDAILARRRAVGE